MARAVRRGTLALVCALLPFMATAGSATADEITGGCTGTVNGQDGTTLTKDSPLIVSEGAQVEITGNVPAQFAAQNPPSTTTVKVSVIDGLIDVTSDHQDSTGPTYSADDVNLDDYFDAGVGLYRIDVTTTGVGWRCAYTAYVRLEGDTLSGPSGLVALGAIIVGAIGAVLAKGRKPRDPGWIDAGLGTADQIAREEAWQAAGREHPDAISFDERGAHGWAPARRLPPNEREIWAGKVRLRGRGVAGFFWGLVLGFGVGVLGWQDARWTLNLGSIVLVPLGIAAASAFIVWFGWGYRIRDVVVLPAAAEPPPPLDPPEPPVPAGPPTPLVTEVEPKATDDAPPAIDAEAKAEPKAGAEAASETEDEREEPEVARAAEPEAAFIELMKAESDDEADLKADGVTTQTLDRERSTDA